MVDDEKLNVGIVGTGNLADLITAKLLKTNALIHVYTNENDKQISTISEIRYHDYLQILSRTCTVIFTISSDGPELENLLFGPEGIANSISSETTIVDMSAVSPELIKEISEQLIEQEMSFLDAAIINEEQADSDEIQMILVGGEEDVFLKVLPIFKSFAKTVKHIGENGASQFYRQAFGVRKRVD